MSHRRWAVAGWFLALAGTGYVLATATGPVLVMASRRGDDPGTTVAAAAVVAGWLVLAWLTLGVLVSLGDALGLQAARRWRVVAPRALRAAVHASIGLSLAGGILPAAAYAGPPTAEVAAATATSDDLPRWPSLDRPARPVPPTQQPERRPHGQSELGYVVRPGDSLWAIAARHLPAGASDALVAAAWPRWWRVNRTVIGDDPDLIRPGQVLGVPRSQP